MLMLLPTGMCAAHVNVSFDEDPDAFDTLYTALVTVSKVAASLLPLYDRGNLTWV